MQLYLHWTPLTHGGSSQTVRGRVESSVELTVETLRASEGHRQQIRRETQGVVRHVLREFIVISVKWANRQMYRLKLNYFKLRVTLRDS